MRLVYPLRALLLFGAGTVACGGDAGEVTAHVTSSGEATMTGMTGTTGTTTTVDTTGAASASADATAVPDSTGSTGPIDNGECDYQLVHEQAGAVLWVSEEAPVLEISPLQPGEGFYCMRVEFDLQTLDNLADLAAQHPAGCPEYLALASVFGTQATGEVMATTFFRGMDRVGESCEPGPPRLEVGNYLDYVANTEGPWSPGQVWRVTIEAKPWLTRLKVELDGAPLGPVLEANLYPANVADTRDPKVRLGQLMPVEDKFYPWYGATYANLKVWADVAPPA